jgi:hypothetical protein
MRAVFLPDNVDVTQSVDQLTVAVGLTPLGRGSKSLKQSDRESMLSMC